MVYSVGFNLPIAKIFKRPLLCNIDGENNLIFKEAVPAVLSIPADYLDFQLAFNNFGRTIETRANLTSAMT